MSNSNPINQWTKKKKGPRGWKKGEPRKPEWKEKQSSSLMEFWAFKKKFMVGLKKQSGK
jgi:hypothetical protein